jgi:hypothetical protein
VASVNACLLACHYYTLISGHTVNVRLVYLSLLANGIFSKVYPYGKFDRCSNFVLIESSIFFPVMSSLDLGLGLKASLRTGFRFLAWVLTLHVEALSGLLLDLKG